MEERTSFLRELGPNAYDTLSEWKKYALYYACVLILFIILSVFFQTGFIRFFINIMMGWSLFSILFICILIVSLDKAIQKNIYSTFTNEKILWMNPRLFSKVLGVTLIVLGVGCAYMTNQYKKYYSFQCETFFLDEKNQVYHILEDCKYIYDYEEDQLNDIKLVQVKGVDLMNTSNDLCDACKEWAEDAEAEAMSWQYRKR